jgi:hypothetical protein
MAGGTVEDELVDRICYLRRDSAVVDSALDRPATAKPGEERLHKPEDEAYEEPQKDQGDN